LKTRAFSVGTADTRIPAGSIQALSVSVDRKGMEPVQGTNISLALIQIAAQRMEYENDLGAAQAKLVLDAVKDAGSLVVELLEGLGGNIDLYV